MSYSRSHVVIAGGGTGGHVFPALAIADGLVECGVPVDNITFFGSGRTLEKEVIPQAGYRLVTFTGRGLNKREFFRNILNVVAIKWACIKALTLFMRHRPVVVVGVGGYASVPALAAATLLGIKRVVHEQNAYLGRTNRLAQKMGATVITTFAETAGTSSRSLHMGLPMRVTIDEAIALRNKYRENSRGIPTVLIAGGSLGSQKINDTVVAMLQEHQSEINWNLIHICGDAHFETLTVLYKQKGLSDKVALYPFRKDIVNLYAQSDCVVSRAGAGTVVELATLGVKCLLIPLSSAPGDHQRRNAEHLEKEQCVILDQSHVSAEILFAEITAQLNNVDITEPDLYHQRARLRIANYLVDNYLSPPHNESAVQ